MKKQGIFTILLATDQTFRLLTVHKAHYLKYYWSDLVIDCDILSSIPHKKTGMPLKLISMIAFITKA